MLPYLKLYKRRLIVMFFAVFCSAAAVLTIGIAIKNLVNTGFSSQDVTLLNETIFSLVAVVTILAIASAVRSYLIESTSTKVVRDIRENIYKKLIKTEPAYFELNSISNVVSKIIHDTSIMQEVIVSVFSFCIRNSLMAVGGMCLLFITSFKLALYSIGAMPLIIIPIIFMAKKVKLTSRESQEAMVKIGAHIDETFTAIKTVQSYNMENFEIKKLESIMDRFIDISSAKFLSKSFLVGFMIWIVAIATSFIIWIGGQMVLSNSITSGELVSFIFYVVIVASAVGGMSEVMSNVNRAAASAERILDLLDAQKDILNTLHISRVAKSKQLSVNLNSQYSIKFDGVGFSYPTRKQHKVLCNFSAVINKGERVMILGPSGSGKTTVLQLLLGFYQLDEGRILINNKNILDINIAKFRNQVSFISQDSFIFSASAYENISYGRPGSDKKEIIAAAKIANIHNFIESLPEGYDTFLGERGVSLSGGQKQRISIARAILKKPNILLLDEASSHLDKKNEFNIYDSLSDLMINKTIIMITHNQNSALYCDKLLDLREKIK